MTIQDADLAYDPSEIPSLIEPLPDGNADVVFGSRFLVRKAAHVHYFYHYLANKSLTFLSNILTNRNFTESEHAIRHSAGALSSHFNFPAMGLAWKWRQTAMVCKTKARAYEVPISYDWRSYEEGKKVGLADEFMALWYIAFFNLIKPLLPSERRYICVVNQFLAENDPVV